MGFLKPNIKKLEAAKDIDGLRAALLHEKAEVAEAATGALVDLLRTGTLEQSVAAARALRESRDAEAVDALVGALEDRRRPSRSRSGPDNPVSETAGESLSILGGVAVGPLIAALTGNTVPATKACAAEALGEIGDPRAVEALVQTLEDPDPLFVVHRAVMIALSKIADPRSIPVLVAALERRVARRNRPGHEARADLELVRAVESMLIRMDGDQARGVLAGTVIPLHLTLLRDAIAYEEWWRETNERPLTEREFFEAQDSPFTSVRAEEASRKKDAAEAKRRLELLSEEENTTQAALQRYRTAGEEEGSAPAAQT